MANVADALIALGKLLGFFEGSGSNEGTVRWVWFGDPVGQGLSAMPEQREHIGTMLRALLERAEPAGAFAGPSGAPASNWEPLLEIAEIGGKFGIVWTTVDSGPLVIGLGAKAEDIGGEPVDLAVLAKVLRIAEDTATGENEAQHALGEVGFSGTFPVPEFLTAGSLGGSVDAGAGAVDVDLTAVAAAGQRVLSYQIPDSPTPQILGWDAARLLVFVLKAFAAHRAQEAAGAEKEFFERVVEHLFPMFGDPPNPIAPFPILADEEGQVPQFDPWLDSVLPGGDDAAGALTFLWHLRALITDNEDPSFFNGSYYFPLVAPSGTSGVGPPVLQDGVDGQWPPSAAGAYVGITTAPPTYTLVIELFDADGENIQVPLAQWNGSTLVRPPFTPPPGIGSFGGGQFAGGVSTTGIVLLSHDVQSVDVPVEFQGPYELRIRFTNGQPPAFVLDTPLAELTFPPGTDAPTITATAASLISSLLTGTFNRATPDENTPYEQALVALADVVSGAVAGGAPDPQAIVAALIALATGATGGTDVPIPVSADVSLSFGLSDGDIVTNVEYGPVDSGGSQPDLTIGKLLGGLRISLDPDGNVLDGFNLGFENLRLGDKGSGGGIVASLIPEMRELSGFGLLLTYDASADPPISLTGGGKIPIQRTLGPLEIAALLVELREKSMAIGLDLGFELGPILVAAYELGLEVRFGETDPGVTPFLHGLGLSMDTDMVKLGGFFADVDGDYIGGAIVGVAGYFELSAIGGYTEIPETGETSLFIFASLVAPLGGPPWFFVTGIAGGFGLNRALPDPALMLEHPFMKVMAGELTFSGDAAGALVDLSKQFTAEAGQFWIAAGIQFISFGFIHGRVVIAISFGHKFSFTILGAAAFDFEPLAYIEIAILTTVDEEKFLLRASISPNSYVLHRDIFSLYGDIALCAWYAPPHDGDFLFSIGGYHPDYKPPEHYPQLTRLGAKATLYEFVHLEVSVYFAATPQALMAGAVAALWGEFMGIAAGCEVKAHVLMTWDPFFIKGTLGVVVWFEFLGARNEVGVELEIYTPEFGGVARITIIVEFEISFGAPIKEPDPPTLAQFLSSQLALQATEPPNTTVDKATLRRFSDAEAPGLLRVEFLSGRPAAGEIDDAAPQEGVDPNAPVLLGPEWSFLVRTRLPYTSPTVGLTGTVDLPLCQEVDLQTTLEITVVTPDEPTGLPISPASVADFYPRATFGPDLLESWPTGSESVGHVDSSNATVELYDGAVVELGPDVIVEPALTAAGEELSGSTERYPVPLGDNGLGSTGSLLESIGFAESSAVVTALKPSGVSRRDTALAKLKQPKRRQLGVLAHSAALLNAVKQSAGGLFTVESAGVGRMAPPPSPARAAELHAVRLRVLPMRSDFAARPGRGLESPTRPPRYAERRLTRGDGVEGRFETAVEVAHGEVQLLELRGRYRSSTLRLSGDQHVRTVALDRGGRVLLDRHERGGGALKIAPGAARIAMVGTGAAGPGGPSGVERSTTLAAISPRAFLAPGCVITTRAGLGVPVHPLDGVPGAVLFARANHVRLTFRESRARAATLVIRLAPLVEKPGPVDKRVRWRAVGARLRDLDTVIGAERVALTMSVVANTAWDLEIDLGPEWRLDGVAVTPRRPEALRADLRRGGQRPLVDDALPPPPAARPVTKASLEVTI
jgi:hypothetical protein